MSPLLVFFLLKVGHSKKHCGKSGLEMSTECQREIGIRDSIPNKEKKVLTEDLYHKKCKVTFIISAHFKEDIESKQCFALTHNGSTRNTPGNAIIQTTALTEYCIYPISGVKPLYLVHIGGSFVFHFVSISIFPSYFLL